MDPYHAAVGWIGLFLADLNTIFASVPASHYGFSRGPQPPSQPFNPPIFRSFACRNKPSRGRPTPRSKSWKNKTCNEQNSKVSVLPPPPQQSTAPLSSDKHLKNQCSSTYPATTQLSPTKQPPPQLSSSNQTHSTAPRVYFSNPFPKHRPNWRIYKKHYQPQQNDFSHDSAQHNQLLDLRSLSTSQPDLNEELSDDCQSNLESDLDIDVGPCNPHIFGFPPIRVPHVHQPEDTDSTSDLSDENLNENFYPVPISKPQVVDNQSDISDTTSNEIPSIQPPEQLAPNHSTAPNIDIARIVQNTIDKYFQQHQDHNNDNYFEHHNDDYSDNNFENINPAEDYDEPGDFGGYDDYEGYQEENGMEFYDEELN